MVAVFSVCTSSIHTISSYFGVPFLNCRGLLSPYCSYCAIQVISVACMYLFSLYFDNTLQAGVGQITVRDPHSLEHQRNVEGKWYFMHLPFRGKTAAALSAVAAVTTQCYFPNSQSSQTGQLRPPAVICERLHEIKIWV